MTNEAGAFQPLRQLLIGAYHSCKHARRGPCCTPVEIPGWKCLSVLATQSDDDPLAGVIAYILYEDLCHLHFLVPKGTRKYEAFRSPSMVLLMDGRCP
jgi:hypothetical protein